MAVAQSIRERQIKVYSTSWCAHSRMSRALLQERGLAFETIDIERDPSAARQVERWNNGYRSTPTILLREIITEPTAAELERIFLESGARLLDLTVYLTTWCPDCRGTMKWLKAHGVSPKTVDIEADEEAAQKVENWNHGYRSVPTLDATLLLTEPSNEELDAALGWSDS